MQPLAGPLLRDVLAYLGVEPAAPDLALLNRLLLAYGQRVPWESASRIAKRARSVEFDKMARWSEEFWSDALALGTGGTCFESNHAMLALLSALGYHGYLTVNNMGDTLGCHTAIVVRLENRSWLVDAGYPIYAALPLDPERATSCASPYLTYSAEPLAPQRYLITNRPHPKPYMFDLLDKPVDDATYRQATSDDYGATGLFLERVIVRKVVDGAIWRFDSASAPPHLERFANGERVDVPIEGDVAQALSHHFGLAEPVLAAALAQIMP